MKDIIATTLTILAFVFAFNTVDAEEKVKTDELAESNITIEFPRTTGKIAVEDEENSRLAALKETEGNNPRKRIRVFEMGESGHTISFPMTAEEIAAENTEGAGLASLRKDNSGKPKNRVIVFDLAESGQTIKFEVKFKDKTTACRDLPKRFGC
jgi:hypothetical protein